MRGAVLWLADDVPVTTLPVISDDRQRYDVTTTLNMALAASADNSTLAPSLSLTIGLAGTVTVYPPEIRYEG